MSDNRLLWVRHRKFGPGYIRSVGTSGLAVKYLLVREPKYYKLKAMDDGTLRMREETRNRIRQDLQRLREHEEKANARRRAESAPAPSGGTSGQEA